MLEKPIYKLGGRVVFNCNKKQNTGVIRIIDAYGTFMQDEEVSYDIYVEEENMLYKHILERNIISYAEKQNYKIIFLDIDGVLNSNYTDRYARNVLEKEQGYHVSFDGTCVMALNEIIEDRLDIDDVRFVLSSTWRNDHTKKEMEALLYAHGFKGKFHDDWATKQLWTSRGKEIQEWLSRHKDVQRFICLDDNTDFADEDRLVLTDAYYGLTIYEVLLAKYLLGFSTKTQTKEAELFYKNQVNHYNKKYF